MELVFDVLSSDAAKITRGAEIMVENSGAETTLQGHVTTVEPSAFTKLSALGIEEQRVNIIGELDEPPPGRNWIYLNIGRRHHYRRIHRRNVESRAANVRAARS